MDQNVLSADTLKNISMERSMLKRTCLKRNYNFIISKSTTTTTITCSTGSNSSRRWLITIEVRQSYHLSRRIIFAMYYDQILISVWIPCMKKMKMLWRVSEKVSISTLYSALIMSAPSKIGLLLQKSTVTYIEWIMWNTLVRHFNTDFGIHSEITIIMRVLYIGSIGSGSHAFGVFK